MPTENRSSNTDPRDVFIRLNPLGLGEADLRKDSTGFEDQRTHSDYLLFLAGYRESHIVPQQHAGPDSYPPCDYCGISPDYHPWHGSGMINGAENRHIHACDGCRGQLPSHPGQPHPEPIAWMVGTAFWWTKEEAERDAAEMNLPVIGLGPMTDTGEVQRLREALKFYADRDHFAEDIGSDWDTVSGEPANVLWHDSEAWFVEDGSIARAALGATPDSLQLV